MTLSGHSAFRNPQSAMNNLVFWDVDTQFDFMTPPEAGGRLYVRAPGDASDPGAQRVVPALERLSDYARAHGILRVATGDWHTLEHREIDAANPDFRTTYPPHCMAGERGAEKIPETRLRDPVVLPLRAGSEEARDAVRIARAAGRDIFVQKEEFSCFTGNPAVEALIEELEADAFVVYGVALDVCVKAAVEGMLDRGRRVWVVEDATWGLGLEDGEALLSRWEERGARRTTTDAVVSRFPPALEAAAAP
jgi:nicotinamidase/pyrazinamidase